MLARWLPHPAPAPGPHRCWTGHALCQSWLAALVGAVAATTATSASVCLLSAWEARNGEGAALWWRALVGEWLAALHIYALRQPWASNAPAVQPPTICPRAVPVVLVHGYLCNHRLWDDMVRALRAQGHTMLAINLEPVFASIDDYAARCRPPWRHCANTPGSQVALVNPQHGGSPSAPGCAPMARHQTCQRCSPGHAMQGTRISPAPAVHPMDARCSGTALAAVAASEDTSARTLMRLALTAQDNIVFPQRAGAAGPHP